jgi:hypothetical protein
VDFATKGGWPLIARPKTMDRQPQRSPMPSEAIMRKNQPFVLTLIVVSASFVPAATAMAGANLPNHNETLLLDA